MHRHVALRTISAFSLAILVSQPTLAKPGQPAAPAAARTPAPGAPRPLADALTGEAKGDYESARILYDDHDYAGALEKLKASYQLSSDPRLLWNMAACQKNLRHYAAVLDLIDRYLAEGSSYVTDSDRAEAATLATTVAAFVTTLTVLANEDGASVYFDDNLEGTTPLPGPLRVDMGTHRVRVAKSGFVDFNTSPNLAGGQPSEVQAYLAAEKHQGQLRVVADPTDVIEVDKHVVGTGLWAGTLPSGTHAVFVSHKGKIAHQTEVTVADGQTNTLHVALQDEPKGVVFVEKSKVPVWMWVAGGAVVAGAGVGVYLATRPSSSKYTTATEGSWGALSL